MDNNRSPPQEEANQAVPLASTVDDRPSIEGVGSRIGPYKLLQQIGEGGFGVVYMAEQDEPVRRRVGLKIIKPGMDSAQVIARFEAERQALAMMDHQNIARVFDAGTTETGRPYFVMELVHGVPITKYCDDSHLTPRERLELFVPVCQAIQHAHQKGVIHRDIKPSNVLVTLYDGKPVPKVIDFGVAKAIEQRLTDRTLFTQYGQIIGTFEYMSPEQAEMSGLGIDTRSDLYSLGVLLYELLTGTTPFEKKRMRSAGLTDRLKMIKEEEPPKPSTRLSTVENLATIAERRRTEPSALAKLLRGELDWIVMKCLEKDRARRYETANGLARDLERYLHDEPVEACPPSTGYRLKKFARKYRTPLRIAGVFVVLLVVAAGVSVWQAVRATVAERTALRERDRAAEEKARAEANFSMARDAVDRYFTKVSENPSMKAVGLEGLRKDLLLQAKEFYERFVRDQPDEPGLRADLGKGYARLGNIFEALGETSPAEANYRKAVAIFQDLADRERDNPEHQHNLAQSQRYLGCLLRDTSRQQEAEAVLEHAVTVANKLATDHGDNPEYLHDLAVAHNELGDLLRRRTDQFKRAEKAFLQGIAIGERLTREHGDEGGKFRSTLAATLGNVMQVYRGVEGKAEPFLLRAADVYEKLAREFPNEGFYRRELARHYGNLGMLYSDARRLDKAEAYAQKAVAVAEKLVAEHPDVLDYMHELGWCNNGLAVISGNSGKPKAALAWSEKAIQTLERVIAKEPRRSEARADLRCAHEQRLTAIAQTGDHLEAARQVGEMRAEKELNPLDLLNLAEVYCICSEAVAKDTKLAPAERTKLKERYASQAMDCLRQALAKGADKQIPLAAIKSDPDFQKSLGGREDFKKLLQEWEVKLAGKK
jgi:serine/threonine protein kinase/tetratricopeptide (TPR) repeat protein